MTNHLSQDIAVVPFMWVIPLSLYLLSFIICFDHERWYLRRAFSVLTLLAIAWLTAVQNSELADRLLEYPQRLGPGIGDVEQTKRGPAVDRTAVFQADGRRSSMISAGSHRIWANASRST